MAAQYVYRFYVLETIFALVPLLSMISLALFTGFIVTRNLESAVVQHFRAWKSGYNLIPEAIRIGDYARENLAIFVSTNNESRLETD